MRRIAALAAPAALLALTLAACGPVEPDAGASIGTGGPAARVGGTSGPVSAGVSTHGPYAAARVVDTPAVGVSVGTGGPAVRVGAGPVRVGVGRSWWRLGI